MDMIQPGFFLHNKFFLFIMYSPPIPLSALQRGGITVIYSALQPRLAKQLPLIHLLLMS